MMGIKLLASAAALAAGCVFAWAASQAPDARARSGTGAPQASSAQATRIRPLPMPASVRLEGEVAVPGLAGNPATITLRVGEEASTVPVTLPGFSIVVPGQRPGAMVSIEIVSGNAKYAAILGSYGRLARKAGTDAVLTPGELDRIRVTAMGTSLHYHVSRVLGGRLPGSDREHEQAIRSVGFEAAVGGNVLQAIAAGLAPLPEGYANGYALIQDTPGLRDYLGAHPALAAGAGAFARQPTGIAFPLAALSADTAVLPAIEQGEATMLPSAARLLLRRNGGFEYHGRSGVDPVATVAALDAGTLRVTPRGPARLFVYTFVEPVPGEPPVQVLTQYDALHETWQRHFVGDRYSLWSVTEAWRISYPENPELAPTESVNTLMQHAFGVEDPSRRIWPADVIDRRVLPYFCLAPDATGMMDLLWACEYGQTTFLSDGWGLVQEIGSKVDADLQPRVSGFATDFFQWTMGPRGTLRQAFPAMDVTYWRLEGGDRPATPVLYLVRAQGDGGETHTLAGTSVLMDARTGAGLDPASAPATWKYGTFKQGENDNAWQTPQRDTVFERTMEGITRQVTHYPDAQIPTDTVDSSWQLVDIEIYTMAYSRLYESRYRGNNGRFYATCAHAYADGATDCIPDTVRYFRPMTRVGDRLYGIEDLYQNGAWFGEAPLLYRYARPTYHDRIADPVVTNPRSEPARPRSAGLR